MQCAYGQDRTMQVVIWNMPECLDHLAGRNKQRLRNAFPLSHLGGFQGAGPGGPASGCGTANLANSLPDDLQRKFHAVAARPLDASMARRFYQFAFQKTLLGGHAGALHFRRSPGKAFSQHVRGERFPE